MKITLKENIKNNLSLIKILKNIFLIKEKYVS